MFTKETYTYYLRYMESRLVMNTKKKDGRYGFVDIFVNGTNLNRTLWNIKHYIRKLKWGMGNIIIYIPKSRYWFNIILA